jgi:hypothetical protein
MTKKIQNYKTELYKRNAQKSLKNSKNIFQDFETAKKGKIKQRSKNFTTKRLKSNEQLVGLEITLIGRIKGAAKARKTTTGLSGTLKPQTILGSEYYSISQKQVFTKWGTLGLTVRNSIRVNT